MQRTLQAVVDRVQSRPPESQGPDEESQDLGIRQALVLPSLLGSAMLACFTDSTYSTGFTDLWGGGAWGRQGLTYSTGFTDLCGWEWVLGKGL